MIKSCLLLLMFIFCVAGILVAQDIAEPDTIEVKRVESTEEYQIDNFDYFIQDDFISIKYDLLSQQGRGPFEVSLLAMVEVDNDVILNITPNSTTGDIGRNIHSGWEKTIVWFYVRDIPAGIDPNDIILNIEIKEQKLRRSFPYTLVGILTAAVGGGAAYYFLREDSDKSGLGDFPGRPQ